MKKIVCHWHGGEDVRETYRIDKLISEWLYWAEDYELFDTALNTIKDVLEDLSIDYSVEDTTDDDELL